jgi:hypothetical protein
LAVTIAHSRSATLLAPNASHRRSRTISLAAHATIIVRPIIGRYM